LPTGARAAKKKQDVRARQQELQIELLQKQTAANADFTGIDDHTAKSGKEVRS